MNRVAIGRLFARERARFAAHYPRLARATLELAPGEPQTPRAGAFCLPDELRVFVYPRTLRWAPGRVVALLRHELAHLARPSNGEAATDRLAERIGGQAIWYDRGDVQTVAPGPGAKRVRPAYLPR